MPQGFHAFMRVEFLAHFRCVFTKSSYLLKMETVFSPQTTYPQDVEKAFSIPHLST